ncbi:glutaminase [Brevibacillus sp. 7WMA2]|uniref:Glutaminase n=1 Tax=Brevibacillus laterosporus LMG 15441 TaxID=1042163 RepID=A0A075R0K8_BRELA|nr:MULTISPECIES: glutaminase [Brevibacillus]HAS02006.1 glutaminase A [Brevibacillus sp.]AIG24971.1 L-glutaminase [Brevibacillus laterosporus LMG 15441]AYK06609.1 glutaminase [Brevibacillus laterosporus]ERM17385.1 glutaminase [Brevibacillus laterosporus PE36]MCR8996813.1 glutaminase [Brevibacillus laterosporus]
MSPSILAPSETEQHQQVSAQLLHWIDQFKDAASQGKCADYIPALGKMNPHQLGVTVIGTDGTMITAGDCEAPFTLQSISKVLSLVAVCMEYGIPHVLQRVDAEPTGDAFNSIIRLEMSKPGRPYNPMINAGAITVSSMLAGDSVTQKMDSLNKLFIQLIGTAPVLNEEVFQSEWNTAHRNRALAYYLKDIGFLDGDVESALEVYLKQCALEVTTKDTALIGLILALDGYHPIRQEQVLPKDVARFTKSLMLTCGMYNASGKFAAFVGVPTKSGVSGGILSAVPPRYRSRDLPFADGCGIGIFSPSIDEVGNSVAGSLLLKEMAQQWDLSIF